MPDQTEQSTPETTQTDSASNQAGNASFEEELARLEDIVTKLDAEDVPIEQAIEYYEQGVKLSAKLNRTLDGVQRKIEILTQNEAGEIEARAFDEETNADD